MTLNSLRAADAADEIFDAIIADVGESGDAVAALNALRATRIDYGAFDALFGFGDSLVDTGGYTDLVDFVIALLAAQGEDVSEVETPFTSESLGYFGDRFSNGPVYFDAISEAVTGESDASSFFALLGVADDAPTLAAGGEAGANFAVGGTIVDPDGALNVLGADLFDVETAYYLREQVDFFIRFYVDADIAFDDPDQAEAFALLDDLGLVQLENGVTLGDALFVVSLGGNDAILAAAAGGFDQAAYVASFTQAYETELQRMIDGGGRNFMIVGAPNVGVSPAVANGLFGGDLNAALNGLDGLTDALNGALFDMAARLSEENEGVSVYLTEGDFEEIIADPAAIGVDPNLLTTPYHVDPFEPTDTDVQPEELDGFSWIDPLHPTTPIHEALFAEVSGAAHAGSLRYDTLFTADPGGIGLVGSVDAEVVVGGVGVDTISGGGGGDLIDGGLQNDVLRGGLDGDVLFGGGGDDRLFGDGGDDLLFGGDGVDVLFGGAGADLLDGGAARDRLIGGQGQDQLFGGAGPDALFGQDGADIARGGRGRDTLSGGLQADKLFGEGGNDRLVGDGGRDSLFGGFGADELDGGAKNDRLKGGPGADTFMFSLGADVIVDFEDGVDRIGGLAFGDATVEQVGDDAVVSTALAQVTLSGFFTANPGGEITAEDFVAI